MTDFIDLTGASGAVYRFRQADPRELPATGGNLVVASGPAGRLKVLLCVATRSLSASVSAVEPILAAHRAARVYMRLNVASATRTAEHKDLVAGVSPEAHADDQG